MKRGTPDHPKTLDLQAELHLSKWGAVGVLECLWHFAAQYARQGDIGRFSDEQIARAIGWEGDAGQLVVALVRAGWLDECPRYRLVIHDWSEHADDTTKKNLARRKLGFATACPDMSGHVQTSPDMSRPPVPVPVPEPTTPPAPPAGGRPPRSLIDAIADYQGQLGKPAYRQDRRWIAEQLRVGVAVDEICKAIERDIQRILVSDGKLHADAPWPPPDIQRPRAHSPPALAMG
jgi:hypothetical protein